MKRKKTQNRRKQKHLTNQGVFGINAKKSRIKPVKSTSDIKSKITNIIVK